MHRTEQTLNCTGSPRPRDLVRCINSPVTGEQPRHREMRQLAWKVLKMVLKLQFLTPKPTTPHGALSKCLITAIGACLGKASESPVQPSSLKPVAQGPVPPHPTIPLRVCRLSLESPPPHQAATQKAVNPSSSRLATGPDVHPPPPPRVIYREGLRGSKRLHRKHLRTNPDSTEPAGEAENLLAGPLPSVPRQPKPHPGDANRTQGLGRPFQL